MTHASATHVRRGPKIAIISGPSGVGKSTIVRHVLAECPVPVRLSVSATTRKPRTGEIDGVHYHFLSREDFESRRQAGEFLECKEVFGRGDWYGTLKSEVEKGLAQGAWVILEIDVEGAMTALESYPDATTIFVNVSSTDELERRLRARGTESEEAIARRLEVARRELAFLGKYSFEVINDSVDQATAEICDILVRLQDTV